MALAIFDLDNTLIAGDSDHRWGEFICASGLVDARQHTAQNDTFLQNYQDGTLDIQAYLNFALGALAGLTTQQVARLQQEFMEDWVEPLILSAAENLLKKHRELGHTLLIITATNTVVTRPIADRLDVKHLIGCEAECLNGVYTGRPTGIPSFQEGKITRLKEWLKTQQTSWDTTHFYSDSHNDLPLLKWVDHATAVDPDPRLEAFAAAQGWPIISLR